MENFVKKLFLDFLDSKKLEIKETTISAYLTKASKYLYPLFENGFSITENKIINSLYTLQRNNNLCGKTMYDAVMLVNAFLSYLYKQKVMESAITIPVPKYILKDAGVFNCFEVQKLERYATNNWDFTIFGILLDLYCGLRIGELCALKWGDINFQDEVIYISNTIQRVKNSSDEAKTKILIDTPKTANSVRPVPIPRFYIPIMEKFRAPENRYILTASTQPVEPRLMQVRYKNLLKQIGIDYRKFHTLRHTFATTALLNGMDIKTLSELLGHVNVAYTLKTYVHLDLQTKCNQLNSIYQGKSFLSQS